MEKGEIERISSNDKEWRVHILSMQITQSKEIKEVKKDIAGLKIKVAGFASFFGIVSAYVAKKMGL